MGCCVNETGEDLLVYGGGTYQGKDNRLMRLQNGRRTPPGWDCDGFYIPADREVKESLFGIRSGPGAVKYPTPITFTVTKVGGVYQLAVPNLGFFAPYEAKCPSS